jgi:hypothetical protein
VRSLRFLLLVAAASTLAGCHEPCPSVNCGSGGAFVDLQHLPSAWLRGARVTGCVDRVCRSTAVEHFQGKPYLFMPTTGLRPSVTLGPRDVEIRIAVAGHRVFTASGENLPVWTKRSRCPNCERGNVYAVADQDGFLRPRSPL